MSRVLTDLDSQTLFTATSSKNVVNTTTKTSALPTSGKGSRQLPNGFWVPGRSLIVEPDGTYQTPAVPGSVTVRVEMGGVVLASVNVAASVLAAGSTVFALWGRVKITCRTNGASGTFVANGYLMFQTGAAGTIPVPINSGNSEVTVDTTAPMTPDVTEQWSNAQAGQGTTINDLTLYVKN